MRITVPDVGGAAVFLRWGTTVRRYPVTMRGSLDDADVAWGSDRRGATGREHGSKSSGLRTYGLIAGFVLALAATVAILLTDDPQYLRLAVLAAAWAFVLAAFLAGRRRADAQAVAAREEEIRRRYEYELDREAAAHREYELELRREAEESMAAELTSLRAEVAELNLLKHEVARVARLGTDLPALSGLRAELTGLAGLRDDIASLRADVASLASLRENLASIAELRAEMGRLRTELTEQLNGEMLIERILLRTQSVRPGDDARTVESSTTWDDHRPPAELTVGRPAVRFDDAFDDAAEIRRHEPVRVERAPAPPATTAFRFPTCAPTSVPARSAPPATPSPPTPLEWLADRALVEAADLAPRHSRHAVGDPDDLPIEHERSGAVPGSLLPPVPPRRRRGDEAYDDRTAERPVSPPTSSEPVVRPAPRPSPTPRQSPTPRTAPQAAAAPAHEPPTAGHERLEQILADTGTPPPVTGRRRRRYREDDEPDDVLARVLGPNGR
jgi:hypothetical protein